MQFVEDQQFGLHQSVVSPLHPVHFDCPEVGIHGLQLRDQARGFLVDDHSATANTLAFHVAKVILPRPLLHDLRGDARLACPSRAYQRDCRACVAEIGHALPRRFALRVVAEVVSVVE